MMLKHTYNITSKPNHINHTISLPIPIMKGNSNNSFSHEHTAKSSTENNTENKFMLFGVVLNPVHNPSQVNEIHPVKGERDESVNSSAASSTMTDHKPSSLGSDDVAEEKKNKFVCQYCLKAFGNSQALGGHQNAHKKERMKKKRLQLQARKASINCYIQPLHNNSYNNNYNNSSHKIISSNYGNNPVWFYDPSSHAPEFSMYDESQISFGTYGPDLERNSPEQISRWYAALPDRVPFQQQGARAFSLTRAEETHEVKKNKHVMDFNTSKNNKLNCNRKVLDLQLGLTLH